MAEGRDLRSRLVSILKVGLPLVALGLISALFLIQGDEGGNQGEVLFSQGDIEALGNGLRVSNPTLTGTTQTSDRFRFTADLVIPDAAPPTRAEVTGLQGRMEFANGPIVDVKAPNAELELKTQRMTLSGLVRIVTSSGYRMHANKMLLDLSLGELEASESVETTGPLGRITSGTLRIEPEGKSQTNTAHLISFGNGVRLLYHPPANPAGPNGPDTHLKDN